MSDEARAITGALNRLYGRIDNPTAKDLLAKRAAEKAVEALTASAPKPAPRPEPKAAPKPEPKPEPARPAEGVEFDYGAASAKDVQAAVTAGVITREEALELENQRESPRKNLTEWLEKGE